VTKPYLDIHETTRGLNNIPGLDGVRAMSILIVMLSHSGLRFAPGILGVTIFFFLSGFLITGLLLDEYSCRGTIDIPKFYARRFLRLYPPLLVYIATMLVALIAYQKEIDGLGLIGALFYFANYLYAFQTPHLDAFGVHLWSLSVEEHFYLLFPLLLLLLRNKRIPVIPVLAVLCVVPLAIRLIIASTTDPAFYLQYDTAATETRFDSILFGCITAVALHQPWRARLLAFATRYTTVWCAVTLLLLSEIVPNPFFRQTLRFTLQNIALVSLMLVAVYTPNFIVAKRLMNLPAVRWIAVLSYSLYLWHRPVFEAVQYSINSIPPTLAYVLGWVLSFAIAFAVHIAVERPIVQLRKRFGSRAHEANMGGEIAVGLEPRYERFRK
jgi:peptidoglycan/LPS O-acetylase OafA/YrhL